LTKEIPKNNYSTFAGTPYYMAPEILNNQNYGLDVDIYALGVLYY